MVRDEGTHEGNFAHEFGALGFELGAGIGVGGGSERGHFVFPSIYLCGIIKYFEICDGVDFRLLYVE